MAAPLVSVLLPTYNRASYLHEAIQSVLNQQLIDLELLVIDDGSTDDTPALLARIADRRLRCFQQTNQGISRALNHGLRQASGSYIALIGSDDRWRPGLLATLVPLLAANAAAGVAYARCQAIDPHGQPLPRTAGAPARCPGQMLKSLLYGDHLCTIGTLTRRHLIEQVGPWDTRLVANEDWDLWLRLARVAEFVFVDQVLADFRVHPGRITSASSAQFARMLADREAVLDRAFAWPGMPADLLALRPLAYRNMYIDQGMRWLNVPNWRAATRAFVRAAALSGQPWRTSTRIIAQLGYQRVLSHHAWGVRLTNWLVRRNYSRLY